MRRRRQTMGLSEPALSERLGGVSLFDGRWRLVCAAPRGSHHVCHPLNPRLIGPSEFQAIKGWLRP